MPWENPWGSSSTTGYGYGGYGFGRGTTGGAVTGPQYGPAALAPQQLQELLAELQRQNLTKPPEEDGGGGLFDIAGGIGRWFGRGVEDIAHVAAGAIPGITQLTINTAQQMQQDIQKNRWAAVAAPLGPFVTGAIAEAGGDDSEFLRKTAGPMVQQYVEDLSGPIQHPGYFGLAVLPGIGAVSKLGMAGKAGLGRAREFRNLPEAAAPVVEAVAAAAQPRVFPPGPVTRVEPPAPGWAERRVSPELEPVAAEERAALIQRMAEEEVAQPAGMTNVEAGLAQLSPLPVGQRVRVVAEGPLQGAEGTVRGGTGLEPVVYLDEVGGVKTLKRQDLEEISEPAPVAEVAAPEVAAPAPLAEIVAPATELAAPAAGLDELLAAAQKVGDEQLAAEGPASAVADAAAEVARLEAEWKANPYGTPQEPIVKKALEAARRRHQEALDAQRPELGFGELSRRLTMERRKVELATEPLLEGPPTWEKLVLGQQTEETLGALRGAAETAGRYETGLPEGFAITRQKALERLMRAISPQKRTAREEAKGAQTDVVRELAKTLDPIETLGVVSDAAAAAARRKAGLEPERAAFRSMDPDNMIDLAQKLKKGDKRHQELRQAYGLDEAARREELLRQVGGHPVKLEDVGDFSKAPAAEDFRAVRGELEDSFELTHKGQPTGVGIRRDLLPLEQGGQMRDTWQVTLNGEPVGPKIVSTAGGLVGKGRGARVMGTTSGGKNAFRIASEYARELMAGVPKQARTLEAGNEPLVRLHPNHGGQVLPISDALDYSLKRQAERKAKSEAKGRLEAEEGSIAAEASAEAELGAVERPGEGFVSLSEKEALAEEARDLGEAETFARRGEVEEPDIAEMREEALARQAEPEPDVLVRRQAEIAGELEESILGVPTAGAIQRADDLAIEDQILAAAQESGAPAVSRRPEADGPTPDDWKLVKDADPSSDHNIVIEAISIAQEMSRQARTAYREVRNQYLEQRRQELHGAVPGEGTLPTPGGRPRRLPSIPRSPDRPTSVGGAGSPAVVNPGLLEAAGVPEGISGRLALKIRKAVREEISEIGRDLNRAELERIGNDAGLEPGMSKKMATAILKERKPGVRKEPEAPASRGGAVREPDIPEAEPTFIAKGAEEAKGGPVERPPTGGAPIERAAPRGVATPARPGGARQRDLEAVGIPKGAARAKAKEIRTAMAEAASSKKGMLEKDEVEAIAREAGLTPEAAAQFARNMFQRAEKNVQRLPTQMGTELARVGIPAEEHAAIIGRVQKVWDEFEDTGELGSELRKELDSLDTKYGVGTGGKLMGRLYRVSSGMGVLLASVGGALATVLGADVGTAAGAAVFARRAARPRVTTRPQGPVTMGQLAAEFLRGAFEPTPPKTQLLTRMEERKLPEVDAAGRETGKFVTDMIETATPFGISTSPVKGPVQAWWNNFLQQAHTQYHARPDPRWWHRTGARLLEHKITHQQKTVGRMAGQAEALRAQEAFESGKKTAWARYKETGDKAAFEAELRDLGGTPTKGPEELRLEAEATRYAEGGVTGKFMDSANQLSALTLLYMKPGYIPPNVLGQILFSTIDHAFNPFAIARSWKMSRETYKLHPELQPHINRLAGAGPVEALRQGKGLGAGGTGRVGAIPRGLARGHEAMAGFTGKLIDNPALFPFRDLSFFNAAYKRGYRTPQQIKELVEGAGAEGMAGKLKQDRDLIMVESNRNMVDYGNLSDFERKYVRRVVLFYPWMKGATMWAGRFAVEHPFQAGLMSQAGQEFGEDVHEVLGDVPSYMKGVFPMPEFLSKIPGMGPATRNVPGLGQVPRVINPAAVTPFGPAVAALQAARGLVSGDRLPAYALAQFANPATSAALGAVTGVDPFTSEAFPPEMNIVDIVAQELGQTIPAGGFLRSTAEAAGLDLPEVGGLLPKTKHELIDQGIIKGEETLLPTTRADEMGTFLTGLYGRTYNPVVSRERAFAEQQSLRDKVEQIKFKWTDSMRRTTEQARAKGILKGSEQLPKPLREAIVGQQQRLTGYTQLAMSRGQSEQDLRQIDRLQTDLSLLVQSGRLSNQQAHRLLSTYATLEDDAISYLRRQLGEGFFGSAIISAYKAVYLQQGVEDFDFDLR